MGMVDDKAYASFVETVRYADYIRRVIFQTKVLSLDHLCLAGTQIEQLALCLNIFLIFSTCVVNLT